MRHFGQNQQPHNCRHRGHTDRTIHHCHHPSRYCSLNRHHQHLNRYRLVRRLDTVLH